MQTIQKSLASSLKVLVIIVPLLGIVFLNKVSGIYFWGYFCYILFFALYRKFTRSSLRRKNTLQFTLAIVAVISAILISVSYLDFTVVETFKKISPFPQNSPYWGSTSAAVTRHRSFLDSKFIGSLYIQPFIHV